MITLQLSKLVFVSRGGKLIILGRDKNTGRPIKICGTGLMGEKSTIKFFGEIIKNKF